MFDLIGNKAQTSRHYSKIDYDRVTGSAFLIEKMCYAVMFCIEKLAFSWADDNKIFFQSITGYLEFHSTVGDEKHLRNFKKFEVFFMGIRKSLVEKKYCLLLIMFFLEIVSTRFESFSFFQFKKGL